MEGAVNTEAIASFDGTELAVHRMGEGRAVLLLHGLFSSAEMNWVRFGHAEKLAGAGFEAVMPDLRAHGESAKPHDPEAYPPGVLAKDAAALVEALGLEGLAGWSRRSAFFIDAIDRFDSVGRGDPAFMAVSFMKTMKIDREAARLLLQAVDDTAPEELAKITMPTIVLCGDKDDDNGSAAKLAEALPDARHVEIPGTHMSSVTEGALGDALVDFLGGED
jgi:pimeloyl-ACP methyl ester carboxylesterase